MGFGMFFINRSMYAVVDAFECTAFLCSNVDMNAFVFDEKKALSRVPRPPLSSVYVQTFGCKLQSRPLKVGIQKFRASPKSLKCSQCIVKTLTSLL